MAWPSLTHLLWAPNRNTVVRNAAPGVPQLWARQSADQPSEEPIYPLWDTEATNVSSSDRFLKLGRINPGLSDYCRHPLAWCYLLRYTHCIEMLLVEAVSPSARACLLLFIPLIWIKGLKITARYTLSATKTQKWWLHLLGNKYLYSFLVFSRFYHSVPQPQAYKKQVHNQLQMQVDVKMGWVPSPGATHSYTHPLAHLLDFFQQFFQLWLQEFLFAVAVYSTVMNHW